MKVKNIDVNIIIELIHKVPSEMDLEAIVFAENDIKLRFTADYSVVRREKRNKAASELARHIAALEQGQNYSEINDAEKDT